MGSRLTSHRAVSLPGLKTSIELEPGPTEGPATSPHLVDRESGQRLPITETEAKVLGVWDGVQTATALSAKLFVEGVDVEPWQVEQFFARLARTNLLAAGGPVVPDFVPSVPGVENPEDIVPTLRGDLVISKSATSKATLEVKDPVSERSFTLYDFEVSIARMLDGKRSAAEVLAAANRLGIPVTLPTLKTFLQQLKAYQFIDLTTLGGESTWPKRRQWSAEVRELYQGALRLMRSGKFDEARGYVEAMKAADPSNDEANTLLERIDVEARGSLELNVPFDTLHTPVTTAAVEEPVPQADPFASFGFHSGPPTADQLPPIPEAVAPVPAIAVEAPTVDLPPEVSSRGAASPHMTSKEQAVGPFGLSEVEGPSTSLGVNGPESVLFVRSSDEPEPNLVPAGKSRRGLFIGAGAVVFAALLFPVNGTAEFPCELQVDELGVPRAQRAGAVGPALVSSGARVEKGAVLARLELAADESPEALEARIKELEAKLATAHAPGSIKAITKAKAALKKATAAVTALQKRVKKASESKAPTLEAKLAEKQTALDAAKATLDELQQPDRRAEFKATLEQLTAKKVTAAVLSERSAIVAPASGLFLAPTPSPTALVENSAYGRVVGPTFRAVTKDPLQTSADSAVFVSAAGRLEVKLEKTVAGVTARLEGKPEWAGAKGTLEVPSGLRPWPLAVLH